MSTVSFSKCTAYVFQTLALLYFSSSSRNVQKILPFSDSASVWPVSDLAKTLSHIFFLSKCPYILLVLDSAYGFYSVLLSKRANVLSVIGDTKVVQFLLKVCECVHVFQILSNDDAASDGLSVLPKLYSFCSRCANVFTCSRFCPMTTLPRMVSVATS